jgi:transcriptional regulator with XRE-family HTH domain
MSLLNRDPQTLGERLRLVRLEHGITWGQVAHLLGVETLEVAAYEQGDPIPQPVLAAFADVFGVQGDWLLFGTGQRYTPVALLVTADTLLL